MLTQNQYDEIIAALRAEIEQLYARIDNLRDLNGELCAEVNAKDARIRELEAAHESKYSGKCELKIKQVLNERGLSQAKIARMCDVNESSMSRIVRGIEPPYSSRGQRIADALGWHGDWRELFEAVDE